MARPRKPRHDQRSRSARASAPEASDAHRGEGPRNGAEWTALRQIPLARKDRASERGERRAELAKQQAATMLFRDAWAEVVAARKGEWKNEDSLRQWDSSLASIDRALGGVPCHLIDANMIRL